MNKNIIYSVLSVLIVILVGILVFTILKIGTLQDENLSLREVEGNEGVIDDVSDEKPFQEQINDKTVRLFPYAYELSINGRAVADVDLPGYGIDTENSVFKKTTAEDVVGLHGEWSELAGGAYTDHFIDLNSSKVISLYSEGGLSLGPKSTVSFEATDFVLKSNLSSRARCTDDPKVESPEDCNELYPVSVDALLLDGVPVVSFDAIDLNHSFHAQGEGFDPSVDIFWLGISLELDRAYFNFLGKTYSINEVGQVEEVELPDDMVEMTSDTY